MRALGSATMLLLALALPAAAQFPTGKPDTLASGRVMAQPVVTSGAPGSFQVFSIALPPAFRRDSVNFLVEPVGEAIVLSQRTGAVTTAADRSVLVTIGVPRGATAGSLLVARVLFVRGEESLETPLMIEVPAVRGVSMLVPETLSGPGAGGRIDFDLTVTNSGNAEDVLRVALELPSGWSPPRDVPESIRLAARRSRKISVRLDIPENASTGDHFVKARVTGSENVNAERTVRIEVGQTIANEAPAGPTLTTSLGTVTVDGSNAMSVGQLELRGQVTSGIAIDARIATMPKLEAAQVRGLARVGAYVSSPSLTLWSDVWRIAAGNTIGTLSDLTGVNASGNGVNFDYNDSTYVASAMAATPIDEIGGHLVGAKFGLERFGMLWSTSFSSMRVDRFNQSLNAVGVGARWQDEFDGTLGADVAYRNTTLEDGLGAAFAYDRSAESGNINARMVLAPGGSGAFARAAGEFSVTADRNFSDQLNIGVSAFSSRDANESFSSIRARSWSVAPQYRFSQETSGRLELRGSSYGAEGIQSYGNEELRLGAIMNTAVSGFNLTGEVAAERLTRTLETPTTTSDLTTPHYELRGNVTRFNTMGRFQIETTYEFNQGDDVVAPGQFAAMLRADRVQLPYLPRNLYLDAEYTHQRWTGARSMNTLRGAASYVLPYAMEFQLSVERNPLYSSRNDGAAWLVAARIDKAISLPRLRAGAEGGAVYQDLNANGQRDADEAGVSGVLVRQGTARATSDRNGNFIFWERARGKVTVEPGSLPFGWLVGDSKGDPRQVPLVPTSSVTVILELGSAEKLRGLDLTNAVVLARDAQGRAWSARRTAPDTAQFEVLPIGDYTLEFDFSLMPEPVRTELEKYNFTAGRGAQSIKVQLAGRPLRFKKDGDRE